jgi:hypothetical protein
MKTKILAKLCKIIQDGPRDYVSKLGGSTSYHLQRKI